MRLAVHQHLHALDRGAGEVVYHNAAQQIPRWLPWLRPDFVVLHPTFLGLRWDEEFDLFRERFRWLAELRCPKLALPQDEYDHSQQLVDWLVELGVTTIYSCFEGANRSTLYDELEGIEFRHALTGYIDAAAAKDLAARMVPAADRPYDLVYRAAKLPYWFGSHGQLKHVLAEVVGTRARTSGLTTDISTRWEDTIFGEGWLDFVMSGRATIGCESGSSVLDKQGSIQARIRQLLQTTPDMTFAELDEHMPRGWDSYAFFALSPRHLEAVITRTAQVLVEGGYSGVLVPDRHYLPLRRDFSNLDLTLQRLRDQEALSAMTDRAYIDVYESGAKTLDAFATELRAAGRRRGLRAPRVSAATLRRADRTLDAASSAASSLRPPVRLTTPFGVAVTLVTAFSHVPELRLLFRAARSEDVRPGFRRLLRDAVRLAVLDRIRIASARNDVYFAVKAVNADGGIIFSTVVNDEPRASEHLTGPATTIVWDHSRVSPTVSLFPRRPYLGAIRLGERGRYEFRALAQLAQSHEAIVLGALNRVTGR